MARDRKLTLKLNEAVIERAKRYASQQNISLSRLIEQYLASVTNPKEKKIEITSLVKSLSGVIDADINADYRKDYAKYLSKKYE